MKFPFILSILLFGFSSYAQETNELKTEKLFVKEGNVVKVTEYHNNGKIAQEGYLKNNKLHGKWVSYSSEGEKISIANYKKVNVMGHGYFGIKQAVLLKLISNQTNF